jgi:NTE family protein
MTHEHTVLVLQGGGALGAYQAGVYEGMAECGFAPDWVAGVSIGAINGALIAGNRVERRLERLREFWNRVSSATPLNPLAQVAPIRSELNRLSALGSVLFGVPGFFSPRVPPAVFAPEGTPGALSVYDTSALRETLAELVDFDCLNRDKPIRLTVGSVNVRSGNSTWFDNRQHELRVEHLMASGSLPPGFPPVPVDGEYYWDGGIVSNSPLWHVLDDSPRLNAFILQIDLFSARGDLPLNLDQVLEREKDIRYSSKTRSNTTRVQELETLRQALTRLLDKLPPELRQDADYQLLKTALGERREVTIAHLINRRFPHSGNSKDYEFSRSTVRELWQRGLDDVRRARAQPAWGEAQEVESGVKVFDLSRLHELPEAR